MQDETNTKHTNEAVYAAGCFWGVEYYFKKIPGVIKTEVGYSGGHTANPSYQDVCAGNTGHFEVIRVVYDPNNTNFEKLTRNFFEIHDPSQEDGQGPDIGEQYRSVIFFRNDNEKKIAKKLISELEAKGYHIATKVMPLRSFWPAEDYHQNYYEKTGKTPYCHRYVKRF